MVEQYKKMHISINACEACVCVCVRQQQYTEWCCVPSTNSGNLPIGMVNGHTKRSLTDRCAIVQLYMYVQMSYICIQMCVHVCAQACSYVCGEWQDFELKRNRRKCQHKQQQTRIGAQCGQIRIAATAAASTVEVNKL